MDERKSASLLLAPVFPVAYLAYTLGGSNRTYALFAATVSLAGILALLIIASQPAAHTVVHIAHAPIDPRLAEAAWRAQVLGNSTNRIATWLLRLPTWIGLIIFTVVAIRLIPKHDLVLARAPQI